MKSKPKVKKMRKIEELNKLNFILVHSLKIIISISKQRKIKNKTSSLIDEEDPGKSKNTILGA